jgi:two-component system phosphate regulon sensor histidine kinase PhoR
MLKSKISRRLIFSFLLITITSLSLLGMYLLQFFYNENLKTKTENLIINARTIEVSLEDELYNPTKQDYVNNEIRKISDATNLRITIINTNGQVIADSWEQTEELDNHLRRLEVQDALHKKYGTSIRYSDTIKENMLYVAMPVYQNGELVGIVRTASTLYPIENSYKHIRNTIFTALCITVILAVLSGFILAHRQIKPIRQMTEDAQKIADGDLDRRIYIYTNDELEVLAQTINKLTTNLEEKN